MADAPVDRIRARPAMYVGDLGQMVTEVVAFNLRGELGGERSTISARVSQGAVDITHWLEGTTHAPQIADLLEQELSRLHRTTAVGLCVVRALCETFTAEVLGGELPRQVVIAYSAGQRADAFALAPPLVLRFHYVPDLAMFPSSRLDLEAIAVRCRTLRTSRPTTLVVADGNRLEALALQPDPPRPNVEKQREEVQALRQKFLAEGLRVVDDTNDDEPVE